MLPHRRAKRERLARIKQLQTQVRAVYDAELAQTETHQEREEAYDRIHAQVMFDENEIAHLQQAHLLHALDKDGVAIPKEYYEDDEWPLKPTLTHSGEMWARRELKKLRHAEIEFWAKIVLPIASLILAIIALLISR